VSRCTCYHFVRLEIHENNLISTCYLLFPYRQHFQIVLKYYKEINTLNIYKRGVGWRVEMKMGSENLSLLGMNP
jgi:hypothetical protein